MRNIALKLRYRGTAYHGWQVQKNDVTVAETVEDAIYKLTGVNRNIRAARGNRFILSEDDSTIYAATFYDSLWDCGLEENDVLDRFHRILSGWTNE